CGWLTVNAAALPLHLPAAPPRREIRGDRLARQWAASLRETAFHFPLHREAEPVLSYNNTGRSSRAPVPPSSLFRQQARRARPHDHTTELLPDRPPIPALSMIARVTRAS